MMYKLIRVIKSICDSIRNVYKNDPVKYCEYYKDNGCSHVDGFLCNYPNCDLNLTYIEVKKKNV